ncbi:family 6 glucosyltransferase [Paenibacillus sp. Soil787]|uniref:family 6 glucosyltransferase n=1 Tax=Paenibacillus sp. Soil787 TaxID=1736411 RepID=UPI000702AC73|nr:family 6 glucosyltransferase [Paenibacillus sp. Soil787]KRF18681.1 hypothetical protein ASG93_11670 [Paenibacillus sp. Soil787]
MFHKKTAMKKVGILYICTGKYHLFWEDFFITSQIFFLPECIKTYYVFTDAPNIAYENHKYVKKIYQPNLGWPGNTMLRFEMFNQSEHVLRENEYLFFFNANIVFCDFIRENEILPETQGLTAVIHPYFYGKSNTDFPYDRNPASLAYIPVGLGNYYFMGGVNGGKTDHYLLLVRMLSRNIRTDLNNGIIATIYDESHLNKYLLDKNIHILNPSYGYPEEWSYPLKPKLMIRDKTQYGGHHFLRHS